MRTTKVFAALAVLLMVTSPLFVAFTSQESDAGNTALTIVDSYYVENDDGSYSVVMDLSRSIKYGETVSGGVKNGDRALAPTTKLPSTSTVTFALSNVSSPDEIKGAYAYIMNGKIVASTMAVECLVTVDLNGGTIEEPTETTWTWKKVGDNYVKSFPFGTLWSKVITDFKVEPKLDGKDFKGWSQYAEETIERNSTLTALWSDYHTVSLVQPANGTIDADLKKASEGMVVHLSAIPKVGYQFGAWSVTTSDKKTIAVVDDSFTMPNADVVVKATFVPGATVTVSAPVAGEGYTTDGATKMINKGGDYTFNVYVSSGYNAENLNVTVGSATVGEVVKEYKSSTQWKITLKNVTTDVTDLRVVNIEPSKYLLSLPESGEGSGVGVYASYNRAMPTTDIDGNPLVPPTQEGRTFIGYYFEGTMYYDSTMKSTHVWDHARAATLEAVWDDEPATMYTVHFFATVTEEFAVKYSEGTGFSMPSEPKAPSDEYKFGGWTDGVRNLMPGDTCTMDSKDMYFWAVWVDKDRGVDYKTGSIIISVIGLDTSMEADVFIDGNEIGQTASRTITYTGTLTTHSVVVKLFNGTELIAMTTTTIDASESRFFEIELDENYSSEVVKKGTSSAVASGNLQEIAKECETDLQLVVDSSTEKIAEMESDIEKMKEAMKGVTGASSGMFFDADVIDVATGESVQIGSLLEVVIEFNSTYVTNIVVSHYHGNGVTILKQIASTDTPRQDTYYIKDSWIHIFTQSFSTFGVGYDEIDAYSSVVTFHDDSGSYLASSEYSFQLTPGFEFGELPEVSKSGYKFLGWYDKDGMKVTSESIVPNVDVDLYAKWSENPNDNMMFIIIGIVAALLVIAIAVTYYFTRIY